MTTTIRYTTEHMGRSTGGTVIAKDFGAIAHGAHAVRDDLRALLAQGRTKGYGPAPCEPSEISDEDHAAALAGFDAAPVERWVRVSTDADDSDGTDEVSTTVTWHDGVATLADAGPFAGEADDIEAALAGYERVGRGAEVRVGRVVVAIVSE